MGPNTSHPKPQSQTFGCIPQPADHRAETQRNERQIYLHYKCYYFWVINPPSQSSFRYRAPLSCNITRTCSFAFSHLFLLLFNSVPCNHYCNAIQLCYNTFEEKKAGASCEHQLLSLCRIALRPFHMLICSVHTTVQQPTDHNRLKEEKNVR